MDFPLLVEALIKYAPIELEQKGYWLNTGRCIASTRVGCEVLKHYGYDAIPVPVMVRACNKLYLDLMPQINSRKISAKEALARGVKLIEIDYSGSPMDDINSRWPGHLVIGVPSENTIIDLDIVAFNRPNHNLLLPRAASMDISKDWWNGGKRLYYPLPHGAFFELSKAEKFTPFDVSPDWTKQERWGRIVRAIIKRIDNAP